MNLKNTNLENGWNIVYDNWGKKEKETICNQVWTGIIGTGAIVVQTSEDGVNWKDSEKGRYAQGLYTTDFATHYADKEYVEIYKPDGKDVLNGLFVKVYYAYQVYNETQKKRIDCLEKYEFYLCSDELNAVAFHNLTVADQLKQQLGDLNENEANIYKQAETLNNEAMTVTGFSIDAQNNPTVSCSVKRDGFPVDIPEDKSFTQQGKYEIVLRSAVGSEKNVVIYVDKMNAEEAMKTYFGDGFINGKRIYDKDSLCPVFEGKETNYYLAAVGNSLPIEGTIENTTSGMKIALSSNGSSQEGRIDEAGDYIAKFSSIVRDKEKESGDIREFVFRFKIIANGTAPGPKLNQESLIRHSNSSIADANPIYYGLKESSATKGDIILAFSTREAAKAYARNYEDGLVKKEEGTYVYKNQFSLFGANEKYDSLWDLADVTEYYADKAVFKGYIDMSVDYSRYTLSDEVLQNNHNLRQLDLQHDVILFGEDQKKSLTDLNSLPLINDRKNLYVVPGEAGKVNIKTEAFKFIKDKYECDSSEVTIKDHTGKEYPIEYQESVEQQLKEYGCPSGTLTICEKTIYGDYVEYEALYIAEDDNESKITVAFYKDDEKQTVVLNQKNTQIDVNADAFEILSFVDALDPYAILIVTDSKKKQYVYPANEKITDKWSAQGDYSIKCVNRQGNSFTVNFRLADSNKAVISFVGDGTEKLEAIWTGYGSKKVELPIIEKIGYKLEGYTDAETGEKYETVIPKIEFKGAITLVPDWEPKKFKISYYDHNNQEIKSETIKYGREYELDIPNMGDNIEFIGWLENGMPVGMDYTLTEERDVELVADVKSVEKTQIRKNSIGKEKTATDRKNGNRNSIIWIMIFVVMAGSTSAVLVLRKVRKLDTNKKDQ